MKLGHFSVGDVDLMCWEINEIMDGRNMAERPTTRVGYFE